MRADRVGVVADDRVVGVVDGDVDGEVDPGLAGRVRDHEAVARVGETAVGHLEAVDRGAAAAAARAGAGIGRRGGGAGVGLGDGRVGRRRGGGVVVVVTAAEYDGDDHDQRDRDGADGDVQRRLVLPRPRRLRARRHAVRPLRAGRREPAARPAGGTHHPGREGTRPEAPSAAPWAGRSAQPCRPRAPRSWRDRPASRGGAGGTTCRRRPATSQAPAGCHSSRVRSSSLAADMSQLRSGERVVLPTGPQL